MENNKYSKFFYEGSPPGEWYRNIVNTVSSAQSRGVDIYNNIIDMKDILANSDILSEDIHRKRLESQIDATLYRVYVHHFQASAQMLNFVFKLQSYLVNSYGSVNNFLNDYSIKVPTEFALISDRLGFFIEESNIEGP